jgi:hypothetical protein
MNHFTIVLIFVYAIASLGHEATAGNEKPGFRCNFKHGGLSYTLNLARDAGISIIDLDPLDRAHLLMNVDVPPAPRGGEWETMFDAHLLVHRKRSAEAEPELVLGFESSLFSRGSVFELQDRRFQFLMKIDADKLGNATVSFVDFGRRRVKAKMRCTEISPNE